jgi:polysaccharide export outer membrane protein
MDGMKKLVFLGGICGLMMTSCMSPERIMYLRDMRPEMLYAITQRTEMKIQHDDRLRILVSSKNPELSAPFNVGVGGYEISMDGEVRTTANSVKQETGYEVNGQGNIDFPVLGTLHVEGLTRLQLSNLIKNRLMREQLINDAIVSVDILNFKIIMMGEVGSTGVLSVPEGKITLLEAIIRSGGLSNNAAMNRIAVIREDEYGRRMMLNDVRTVALFDAPSFYLQQNDIVYALPKTAPRSEIENRGWQIFSTATGLLTTIASVILLIRSYN